MLLWLPLHALRPHPQHESIYGDAETADESLIDSMRRYGLVTPLTVRPLETANTYEILSGHRRWHAAQYLGWAELPCLVVDVPDSDSTRWLVESNRYRLKTYAQRCRESDPRPAPRAPKPKASAPPRIATRRAPRTRNTPHTKTYALVYAAPDWRTIPTATRPATHTPAQSLGALIDAQPPTAPNAILGINAPPTHTAEALRLMHAWGFHHATSIACIHPQLTDDPIAQTHHTNLHIGIKGTPPPPQTPITSVAFDPPETVLEHLYPHLTPRLALWTTPRGWDQ